MSRASRSPLFRAAELIRRHLDHSRRGQSALSADLAVLESQHELVNRTWLKMRKALQRGWLAAAAYTRIDLLYHARMLQGGLNNVLLHDGLPEPVEPSPGLLVEELKQLEEEFEKVDFLPENNRLVTATTKPIELEGVNLGAFAISLHLDRLGGSPDSSCFRCVALEPNAASGDELVTHPHVRSEGLCAGDASMSIALALKQGRISDAFRLVRSVLHTYNSESPYIALDDWEGVRCHDCDRSISREDRNYCEGCEHDVCDECSGLCAVCDNTYCCGCLEKDRISDRYCCPSCRHTCSKCNRTVDSDSFDLETDLCPQCLAAQEAQQEGEAQEEGEPNNNPTEDPHETIRETQTAPTAIAVAAESGTVPALLAVGMAEATAVPARRRNRSGRLRRVG